jgi:hypothetical protein
MDNSLHELEKELTALKPRRAEARWLNQINRELAAELPASARPVYSTATNLGSWKWLGWRSISLAAALAVVAAGILGSHLMRSVPAVATAVVSSPAATHEDLAYQPVAAANVLYDLKDEGSVSGNAEARRVRARFVDTYTWKNPRTNASIKWTVPRDEVRVVPASFPLN